MWKDPIVEEVRKIREEHAARFDHDLDKIVADLKEKEARSGREYVNLAPKRPHAANRKNGDTPTQHPQ